MGLYSKKLSSGAVMQGVTVVLSCLVASAVASRSPYIFNGEDANVGEFPWQASLQSRTGTKHSCGASLVSEKWLVTAAHCIVSYKTARGYRIVLGAHDKNKWTMGSPRPYYIKNFYKHPKWTGKVSIPSDIALIELASPVQFNEHVQTIALPNAEDKFEGESCMISGWGSIDKIGGTSPNILQKLAVTVDKASHCHANGAIPGFHICARKDGSSACSGDSGGPLACKRDGTWYLAGAASYVWGGCSGRMPTVYSGVAYHREWIKETVGL